MKQLQVIRQCSQNGCLGTFWTDRGGDPWDTDFPSWTTHFNVDEAAELSGKVFVRSFTIENIISSFRATGIFNPNIFTDDMLLLQS